MKPLVAVTMGSSPGDSAGRPARATLNAAYLRAIENAGAAPVLLAPGMDHETIEALMTRVTGLVLTGGGDIDPARYGEAAHEKTTGVSLERDEMEDAATLWALERDIPILAICRGLQFLNVALGGSLHQHLPEVVGDRIKHAQTGHGFTRAEPTHSVRMEPGSCLSVLLGADRTQVNSMHHQSINQLGSGLVATAWADDDCIEGAELTGRRFVAGVQWHPEEMAAQDEPARRLFAGFVAAAGRSQG
ncbi:MAG: gamma-glutamyl-gamma-aminobutyrate hydrolase family protein [Anaerolineaceae bacterium]